MKIGGYTGMVETYLRERKVITRDKAMQDLGISRAQLWSAISRLRGQGLNIVIHRNAIDYARTTYALLEDECAADEPSYGLTSHPKLWGVWRHMRERCSYPKHKSYKDYGGRGIKVCDEWNESFEAFARWAYANGYDDDAPITECTLDRIDPNGNYEPSNCRWTTMKEQANNRRNNVTIVYQGRTQNICEWANELHIPRDTLCFRIRNGWSIEKAFTTPVRKQKNNKPTTWVAK